MVFVRSPPVLVVFVFAADSLFGDGGGQTPAKTGCIGRLLVSPAGLSQTAGV